MRLRLPNAPSFAHRITTGRFPRSTGFYPRCRGRSGRSSWASVREAASYNGLQLWMTTRSSSPVAYAKLSHGTTRRHRCTLATFGRRKTALPFMRAAVVVPSSRVARSHALTSTLAYARCIGSGKRGRSNRRLRSQRGVAHRGPRDGIGQHGRFAAKMRVVAGLDHHGRQGPVQLAEPDTHIHA